VNGDKRADLVGFGDAGVWIAQSTGSSFSSAQFVLANFGYNQGWRVEKHVRLLGDINGDGHPDIVAFGDAGVWTALGTGSGFSEPHFVVPELGYDKGWVPDKHLRILANLNGDACDDIVAFGQDGVWFALADGSGGFSAPIFAIPNFGANQAWDPAKHPRIMADINGDGRDDIVAFGDDGVWTALSTGTGFAPPHFVLADFGYNQGWRLPRNTRQLADWNGDGKPDIIGLGMHGIGVALSNGDGTFGPQQLVKQYPGTDSNYIVDLNGDGVPDFVEVSEYGFLLDPNGGLGRDNDYRKNVIYTKSGLSTLQGADAYLWDIPAAGDPLAVADVNGDGRPDFIDLNYSHWSQSGAAAMVALSADARPNVSQGNPPAVQIAGATNSTLTVQWQEDPQQAPYTRYFVVRISPDPYLPGSQDPHRVDPQEVASSSTVFSGLSSNTQYCFEVVPFSWFGLQSRSASTCGRTRP
jgi:hypothetical protein